MTHLSEQMTLTDDVTDRILDALWKRLAAKDVAAEPPGSLKRPGWYLQRRYAAHQRQHEATARNLLAADPTRTVNDLETLLTRTRPPLAAVAGGDTERKLDRELGLRGIAQARAALAGGSS